MHTPKTWQLNQCIGSLLSNVLMFHAHKYTVNDVTITNVCKSLKDWGGSNSLQKAVVCVLPYRFLCPSFRDNQCISVSVINPNPWFH